MGTSASSAAAPAVIDALAWVHVREGRVLKVRSTGKDAYYLPGGKREPGESDAEALLREVEEELSVRLRPETLEPFAVIDAEAHGHAPGTRVRLTCYTAEHDGEPVPSREIEEIAWLGLDDAARCAPAGRRVLERLHERGLIG
ncbi:NUDIX hydrolase [Marinactinospora thermotolerans]|uniref:ADP-ribose pyrophosphatase YjhB, NUDIX family n=1 Tax=Marinactinospora thermotolerans DSM 45154 TaxID=1122192 RepID=A0A1T4MXA2_9ACTN|nr:NUDIX domain-containing protein [Marinactinospora thermotolerans]SJZ71603.1 ADP-ribose pyrophosphatase YjhB, NUDIX family [Marinactinospora thermotolerans DSM 45154]